MDIQLAKKIIWTYIRKALMRKFIVSDVINVNMQVVEKCSRVYMGRSLMVLLEATNVNNVTTQGVKMGLECTHERCPCGKQRSQV